MIPGALSGCPVDSVPGANVTYPEVGGGGSWIGNTTAFTDVTSDLYYSAGHLGALKFPAINLSVKIYQGTDSAALKEGGGSL